MNIWTAAVKVVMELINGMSVQLDLRNSGVQPVSLTSDLHVVLLQQRTQESKSHKKSAWLGCRRIIIAKPDCCQQSWMCMTGCYTNSQSYWHDAPHKVLRPPAAGKHRSWMQFDPIRHEMFGAGFE